MGYVDIHCHLLWGIDDGCRGPEEALESARVLVDLGFGEAAPSPHARADFPSQDGALCRTRLAELRDLLAREGVPLRLHPNAENFLDDAVLRSLDPHDGLGA